MERRVEMKYLTGCPQVAFAVCPALLLKETKSYEKTEVTEHLHRQKPDLTTNKTYKSPAEGTLMIADNLCK